MTCNSSNSRSSTSMMHLSQCSNNSVSSYTKSCKLDLKIDLNSNSQPNHVTNHPVGDCSKDETEEGLKLSVTPLTPTGKQSSFTFHPDDNDSGDLDVDSKHYKVTVQGQTPTPSMKRRTPSCHGKETEEFPITEPVMASIPEHEHEHKAAEQDDAGMDDSGSVCLHEDELDADKAAEHEHKEEEEQADTAEDEEDEEEEDEEEEEETSATSMASDNDRGEESEDAVLGRFGYSKLKVITKTLQGNIFIARVCQTSKNTDGDKAASSSSPKKAKEVVIKKTSKALHCEHVTVQNGKKFGIYENILKECIILKHLTENRNGLIMTSFTKYDNFFDDANFYYLSMEHGGSDLFDFIIEAHELIAAKKLKIKEWRKFTKYLFWQMIVVMRWLHNDMNICHLDVSLENILIKNGNFIPLDASNSQYTINSNVQIKVCDFGLAEIFDGDMEAAAAAVDGDSNEHMFECSKFCGKTNYKAPEVYNKRGVFDARKADMWSLGVVLFCMLVGSPPYNKPVESDQAYLYIKNGIIDQLLFQWERNHFITVKVLSLLHSMLCYDASKRFLVDDVIQHSWLSLYFHKYKHQMLKKSQLQKQKNQRMKPRLPYYRLPQNTIVANISQ
eukprot:CAMPEP_0197073042 /NCGR_PEP_ID=MMETSP1384-20130603/210401_1 /TAXON_ID=29189 /ORGANISM="Ammonia sp." /LENGTH=613 /DNA_ID=CAMNT_0042511867 /DNA_START=221 /DNA_END=2062 /DNA_ORIENTATION=+